ncbi:MAG: fibronectin type III domain-containing protein, partial [Bacteroidetes bacterium]|nr:fibronectin type III domain-containing protein [Bacteroidota bacterium]
WTRRGLWNRQYSEAWRPNVPSMLLELLSHQNLADMSFGRDPRFRFSVSRAIYKGMLRFLAEQEDKDFVVQPLPVDHFSIALLDDKNIRLSWKSVSDPLEPSAAPEKYKVYKRTGKKGFDNGILVTDTSLVISLEEFNRIYSFKVTAVNEGGESFPSEILSVGVADNEKTPVLIINAFDRIGGQAVIDKPGIAGIAHWQDQGVPDKYDFGHTGAQYDFSRQSDWLDDDSPGWGASYGNMEGKRIPGNSFDFPYIHGEAILEAGYSFVSTSDETFCQTSFDITPYSIVDFIIGEEKGTSAFKDVSEMHYRIFTPKMRKKIEELTQQRANLFLSGAYIGSDHILAGDTLARNFAKQFLHFNWRTNHAVKEGALYSTDYAKNDFSGHWQFNTAWHPELYTVEAPDAIEPSGEGAITAFRYHENNSSGGILFKGDYKTVVLGFPFETILEKRQRNDLMKQVLDFFDSE